MRCCCWFLGFTSSKLRIGSSCQWHRATGTWSRSHVRPVARDGTSTPPHRCPEVHLLFCRTCARLEQSMRQERTGRPVGEGKVSGFWLIQLYEKAVCTAQKRQFHAPKGPQHARSGHISASRKCNENLHLHVEMPYCCRFASSNSKGKEALGGK